MNRRHKRRVSPAFFNNLSVTLWLIIINVLFFLVVVLTGFFTPDKIKYIALSPELTLQGKYLWTLVTSMFMHGGIAHLLINMFVLFSLGGLCEKIIGRRRFLAFYLISGIVAGLLFVVLAGAFGGVDLGARIFGSIDSSAVGASGAIFAIAGLFVVLLPKIRFMIIFLPFFSLPGYVMVPLVLIVTWVASAASGFPIGNTAHLGGFLAGLVYGAYLRKRYRKKVLMLSKMFR
ncbi:MAG: rhomboid family intramembrane serine protease [archaeon]